MKRLGDEIRGELARFGPQAGLSELVAAWPDAVGEAIARNAWPARVSRDGTLHVHAASSTWAFELGQLAPTILERLRAALGPEAPPKLQFRVGPLPAAGAPEPEPAGPRRVEPTAQERAAAEQLVAGIDDEELRVLVARAAAASLARGAADRSVW